MERAFLIGSLVFHCTWNRDAVWKISEDHDSADLFRLGAGV